MLEQARVDEVDEVLEHPLLLAAIVRPEGGEARLAAADLGHAEEVLEAAVGLPERVALDVEEEVARRRLWEQAEAALGLEREELVDVLVRPAEPELELGLPPELREGRGRH